MVSKGHVAAGSRQLVSSGKSRRLQSRVCTWWGWLEGWAPPGASSTPFVFPVSTWPTQQSGQNSYPVAQGSVRERNWKPPICKASTQTWHCVASAIFSWSKPVWIPKGGQCQRIYGLFYPLYLLLCEHVESKKCALLIFASLDQKSGYKHKDKS